MVCVIPYSYQKCDEFYPQAKVQLAKYKKDKIEAWMYLEKHEFNVSEALNDIKRKCQVCPRLLRMQI